MKPSTDPRNIGDKSFVACSLKILVDYLLQHGYDLPISNKILSRPAVKDFTNIVMFLFKQIDPFYVSIGKFEDEMPLLMRYLGYPYQINKSHITAVGSPHAWPSLLASIMWLVELLTYDEAVMRDAQTQGDNGNGVDFDDITAHSKEFNTYLAEVYNLFLSGDDDRFMELENKFMGVFKSNNDSVEFQVEHLKTQNAALENEIQALNMKKTLLPEAEKKKQDFIRDFAKFELFVSKLEEHNRGLQTKATSRKQELDRLNTAIAGMENECNHLQERVSNQELSQEDVKRMLQDKAQNDSEREKLYTIGEGVRNKVWELDTVIRDKFHALEHTYKRYNSLAESLKLIPSTARNARGRNLSVVIDLNPKKPNGLLKTNIRGDIVPILRSFCEEVSQSTAEVKQNILTEKDACEEMEIKLTEFSDKKNELEAKLKRLDETYRREKDRFELTVESNRSQVDKLEERLLKARDIANIEARFTIASRKAKEVKALRDRRKEDYERTRRDITMQIFEAVELCATLRENASKQIGDVKQRYCGKLEAMLNSSTANPHANFLSLPAPPLQFTSNSTFHNSKNINTNSQTQNFHFHAKPVVFSSIPTQQPPPPPAPAQSATLFPSDVSIIEDDFDKMNISDSNSPNEVIMTGRNGSNNKYNINPTDFKGINPSVMDMSPIVSSKYDENRNFADNSMIVDLENERFLANLTRVMHENMPSSTRLVHNLSGLINECAKEDRNLLDESISSSITHMDLQEL